MFKIVTENTCDLSLEWLRAHDVGLLYLSTIVGDAVYNAENPLDNKDFYRMLKEGAKPSTSQVNVDEAKKWFEEHINDTDQFLYIGFASGLSGTVNSVTVAVSELKEKYPDKQIEIVDTQAASASEGLLVVRAVQMRDEGKSFEEVTAWVREYSPKACTLFTVDDLMDLWRGGRVKKSSAIVGNLAGIKPILYLDDSGKIQTAEKIRGRKKALSTLVEYLEVLGEEYRDENEQMLVIAHGDAEEDAEYVKKEVEEKLGYKNFMITNVGPIIGTHTGASLVVLAFFGKDRHR
ncbi:MAG: DegV family protein [Lachnospiraceae bacterium]|nr:DegV family protein [Lachnospiraceae bacterium]